MKFTIEKLSSMPMFWRTLTPFESTFIRQRQVGSVVEINSDSNDGWDLISETAFMLASGTLEDDEAFVRAREKISRLDGVAKTPITELNRRLVYELRDSIILSVEAISQGAEEWMPAVPGCAALSVSEADLLCGNILIEFKCVARNFSPKDLRQVLLYSAMLAESGTDVVSFAILNPRMGCSIRSTLQEVSLQVSGRPWVDIRLEIINNIEAYSRVFIPSRF